MEFDKEKTKKGYLHYEFDPALQDKWNQIKSKYPRIIQQLASKKTIDFGINFEKPFELFENEGHIFIEYLFVGKLIEENQTYLNDEDIGINIFVEDRFGNDIFEDENLLNLTIILESL